MMQFWRAFCPSLGSTVTICHHLLTKGQTERLNQETETMPPMFGHSEPIHLELAAHLGRICSQFPAMRIHGSISISHCLQLPTASLSCAAALGQCSLCVGLDPTWGHARCSLLCNSACYKKAVDHCCTPAPEYQSGQRVWLSTRSLSLHVENPGTCTQVQGLSV